MRAAGTSPGIQSFLAGATDFSKVGNSAQINAAKEHGQAFENNAMAASAGIGAQEQITNADRYADAASKIAGIEASATMAQTGASALGSVASVFGKAGAFGDGIFNKAAGGVGDYASASTPITKNIDYGSAWSSGVG